MEKKRIGIIGGGISGAALGYYLSLYEEADITIFEKNRIGCGTTAKSAGTAEADRAWYPPAGRRLSHES